LTKAARRSDEPARVEQLIGSFLTGQSGSAVGPPEGPGVLLLAGADSKDDCAVFEVSDRTCVVVGSDYVRGPKFALYEMGLLSNFDVGYYLAIANISDVAAMGAAPIGMLSVVRYPREMSDSEFYEVMAGIHQGCTDCGTLIVGGDIGGAERLILSGSALGVVDRDKLLLRRGAHSGDLLCVTGPCGVLGAAVAYFPRRNEIEQGLSPETEAKLLHSWKRPRARVAEGRALATKPFATACQDSSDGLKATIEQICEASGVGFDVEESAVPIAGEVRAVAEAIGVNQFTLAMSASSDFQLVFTLDPSDLNACRDLFRSLGLVFHVIGQATRSGMARAVAPDGTARPLPGVAWKHQQSNISTLVVDGGG
jgi:thiamine-monophosphate kinase